MYAPVPPLVHIEYIEYTLLVYFFLFHLGLSCFLHFFIIPNLDHHFVYLFFSFLLFAGLMLLGEMFSFPSSFRFMSS